MSVSDQAIKKAQELGVTVTGFVPAEMLKDCPSSIYAGPQGFCTFTGSIMVLGLYHDPNNPEMDWWEEGKSTPGDRMLYSMTTELCMWLKEMHGIDAHDIPYQIHDGGIYLKDAAVMAGMGFIGRNNLVIIPGLGPRIRFRALWVDLEVPEPVIRQMTLFCEKCKAPCHEKCPMNSFSGGKYQREKCLKRINRNKKTASGNLWKKKICRPVDLCRICELICPCDK